MEDLPPNLPRDWEEQVARAYATMGIDPPPVADLDGMDEFGWREFLQPRTNIGRFARKPRGSTTPESILRLGEPHRASLRTPKGHRQVAAAIRDPSALDDARLDDAIEAAFEVRRYTPADEMDPVLDAIDMLVDEKHRRHPIPLPEASEKGLEPEEVQILQDAIDREFEPLDAGYLKWMIENLGSFNYQELLQIRNNFAERHGRGRVGPVESKQKTIDLITDLIADQLALTNFLFGNEQQRHSEAEQRRPGAMVAHRRGLIGKLPKRLIPTVGNNPYGTPGQGGSGMAEWNEAMREEREAVRTSWWQAD